MWPRYSDAELGYADLMDNAKAYSDQAIIVITRVGGEGADLPTYMYELANGTAPEVGATPRPMMKPSTKAPTGMRAIPT